MKEMSTKSRDRGKFLVLDSAVNEPWQLGLNLSWFFSWGGGVKSEFCSTCKKTSMDQLK